jgi:hypothetical protein
VEMLKVNKCIGHIGIGSELRDNSIWQNKVKPRLEINKLRHRIVAVQKAQDPMRAPLFGRAVHAVNDNETFLYMMVKGNIDLVVHSMTTTLFST